MVYAICVSLPGHDRYYNKYINVRKGGIGGVAMLLAGYVAMSYLWEYDHISKKRVHSLNITSPTCHKYEKLTFLHLLFQNTIAGGSTTEPLQQPSDLQGLNSNLSVPPALSTLRSLLLNM